MRSILCLLAAFLLASCGGHQNDYLKKGQTVPQLVVPHDVPTIKQEPYYPVPNIPDLAPPAPNSLVPPTLK